MHAPKNMKQEVGEILGAGVNHNFYFHGFFVSYSSNYLSK